MKKILVFIAVFLSCLPAISKVIILDCVFEGEKNKMPFNWPVLISMDTEAQTASATKDGKPLIGKLSTDGVFYWFTVSDYKYASTKYLVNRHDLSLSIQDTLFAEVYLTPGKCEISERKPKI